MRLANSSKQIMRIETNMPLSSLIEKLLKGEAAEVHDEDFRTYVDSKMGNSHEAFQQALIEIEGAIDDWKCSYFISVYDERVNAYRTGNTQWTPQDLDDLFVEEECLRKEGKTALTVDYLYDEIERMGFINEYHRDAMDMARLNNDIDLLKNQWEDLVLAQIRSLEGIINQMLSTASTEPKAEKQKTSRPEKQPIDPPEVFGVDMCCEITGYKKNTIYKLIHENEIPCFRPGNNGRKVMFRLEEIYQWMTKRKQESNQEYIEIMDKRLLARKNK